MPDPAAQSPVLLNVFVSGRASPATPSIVCLHFWGGAPELYQPLMDELPDMHIIAPAFRQNLVEGSEAGYTEMLASDVMNLVLSRRLHTGAGYVVVGHSMGGKVAQALAARRPPGLHGLVLVAPAPLSPSRLSQEMVDQQINSFHDAESAEHTIRNQLLGRRDAVSADLMQRLLWSAVTSGKAWPMYGMREDLQRLAVEIRCRVLAVVGTLDRIEPETRVRAEVLARLVRAEGTAIVRLEHAGHLVPLEAPGRLAEIIRHFVHSFCK